VLISFLIETLRPNQPVYCCCQALVGLCTADQWGNTSTRVHCSVQTDGRHPCQSSPGLVRGLSDTRPPCP